MCNGSVRFLADTIAASLLSTLCTRAGGELDALID